MSVASLFLFLDALPPPGVEPVTPGSVSEPAIVMSLAFDGGSGEVVTSSKYPQVISHLDVAGEDRGKVQNQCLRLLSCSPGDSCQTFRTQVRNQVDTRAHPGRPWPPGYHSHISADGPERNDEAIYSWIDRH